MGHTTPAKPFHYGTQAPTLHRIPVQTGKVLVVRGRTASQVYHTDHHCSKLRGVAKYVKLRFALTAGRVKCDGCKPDESLCTGTSCQIGILANKPTRKTPLHRLRQLSLQLLDQAVTA